LRSYCQIHDTYIVEETDEGFLLIDQHALHERILYEELRRRVARAAVPRQRLLVPEIIDLAPADFARIMELKEQLLKMGLEVEPFGERTIAVQAVPHLAGDAGPRELLLDIVREIRETPAGRPGQREEQLMRVIACKTAIKAGERLTRSQIEALLEQRARIGPEPVCPHGRPTTVEFDLPHIERQFHRR
jgi:DNA mismatch repair protein MutL